MSGAGADLVLVTGPGGYLGGRLVPWLAGQGRRLRLLTRASTRLLPAGEGLERMEGDLLDPDQASAACAGVHSIVHLAAPNEILSERDPAEAVAVTVNGTVRLLQAAQAAGVRRFIYLSTAHVYRSPLDGDIDENTLPRPVHPYAISHRAAEDFVLAAGRRGLEVAVLRLSNAVGPPAHAAVDRWSLLSNDLCRQAVHGRQLVLRSSGLQWRDFIPMADACRAIEHFLRLPAPALGEGLVNLGSGEAIRVIDLTEQIRDRCRAVLGFAPEIRRPAPAPDERHQRLRFSVDRLRATGFTPAADLQQELDATLLRCQEWA